MSGRRPHHSGRSRRSDRSSEAGPSRTTTQAFAQAYEASLTYGQDELAREVATRNEDLDEASRSRGRGLIRWAGEGDEVWAERHDVIHLLAELPQTRSRSASSHSSSSTDDSSWSLPSDIEETFFLTTAADREAYERKKRQAWVDRLREERLAAREEEDRADAIKQEPMLGWKTTEKPPDAILGLMKHTAQAITASPNPHLLEMRIMTNHAADARFDFLRGRYADTWAGIKQGLRNVRQNDPKRKAEEGKAVGALIGGYESSDEDDPPAPEEPPPPPPASSCASSPPTPPSLAETPAAGAAQAERKARLAEWKRKREV